MLRRPSSTHVATRAPRPRYELTLDDPSRITAVASSMRRIVFLHQAEETAPGADEGESAPVAILTTSVVSQPFRRALERDFKVETRTRSDTRPPP